MSDKPIETFEKVRQRIIDRLERHTKDYILRNYGSSDRHTLCEVCRTPTRNLGWCSRECLDRTLEDDLKCFPPEVLDQPLARKALETVMRTWDELCAGSQSTAN